LTIIGFLGGPVIRGLVDAYNAHLKAQSADAATAANLAGKEIAAQVSEANAIMQYRIAEIGHSQQLGENGQRLIRFAGAIVSLGQSAISRGGLLVCVPGGQQSLHRNLVWVDRQGSVERLERDCSQRRSSPVSGHGGG